MCNRTVTTNCKPQEQRMIIGKYNINYVKVGSGPHHVLCIPGSLGSWEDFGYQIDEFNKEKFTLVILDPPGFGKSRPPEREYTLDHQDIDATVAHALMMNLKIPRYSLLGWSGGVVPCMYIAATHPDVAQKLVVWGAQTYVLPSEVKYYQFFKDITQWSEAMRRQKIEMYGEETLLKLWSDWVDTLTTFSRIRNGDICTKVLPKIACPTFALWGEKDPLVAREHIYYLQKHIKNCEIYLYPKGSHNIHMRYHTDFNTRVQEFLLSN
ncbi:unnamed protein product [Leptosia nina]|uniref:AB hydrolase-1 domain-containing protein n=1 Tax=Leptosia nina TaxID=320188 RepID=A0AAV1IYR2_9NEOP